MRHRLDLRMKDRVVDEPLDTGSPADIDDALPHLLLVRAHVRRDVVHDRAAGKGALEGLLVREISNYYLCSTKPMHRLNSILPMDESPHRSASRDEGTDNSATGFAR